MVTGGVLRLLLPRICLPGIGKARLAQNRTFLRSVGVAEVAEMRELVDKLGGSPAPLRKPWGEPARLEAEMVT